MFSWKVLWSTVLTLVFTPVLAGEARRRRLATAFFGTASDWLDPTVTVPVGLAAGPALPLGPPRRAAAGSEQRRQAQGRGRSERALHEDPPVDTGGHGRRDERGEVLLVGRGLGHVPSLGL